MAPTNSIILDIQRRAMAHTPTEPTDTYPMYRELRNRIDAAAQFARDERFREERERRKEEWEYDRMLRVMRKRWS